MKNTQARRRQASNVLTENSGYDADQVDELLEQVGCPVGKFYGDGAYDKWKVYGTLAKREIAPVIPPQRNAKFKHHGNTSGDPLPGDVAIREIRRTSRKRWKENSGYHRRSLSETATYRMKCCFGSKLKNREL